MIYLAIILLFSIGCDKPQGSEEPNFDPVPVEKIVTPIIYETSGIADSKINPGALWVQEDSGNPPQLHLVKHDGSVIKTIHIKGAINRDWEELALSDNKIFIGEIGDNNRVHSEYAFYIFPEPAQSIDTVHTFEHIRFQYPDGAHDAEAFLVDPQTRHIYIITKNDNPSRIYKLTYPYNSSTVQKVSHAGVLPYSGVVSSAISVDGSEIIVKSYPAMLHYKRSIGESIEQALAKEGKSVPYKMEPQGEAVTFATGKSGYFTMSEKGFAANVKLYFYSRK